MSLRSLFTILALGAIGCGNGPATNLLCGHCVTDADCNGNPCFADVTGSRFCGAPCEAGCPSAFSCSPVGSTSMGVIKSCFPKSLSCAGLGPGTGNNGGSGGSGGGSTDMSVGTGGGGGSGGGNDGGTGVPPGDMALPPCLTPAGGTVTTTGGTVDRLYFGYTGDTRMMSSGSGYTAQLQMVINNIFSSMKTQGVEFALDRGDHMEASNYSDSQGNMADYLTATKMLGKPVFMTMGNHECGKSYNPGPAAATSQRPGPATATTQLHGGGAVGVGKNLPYYRVDVMTQSGKAAFIVVADDAWNTRSRPGSRSSSPTRMPTRSTPS